MSSLLVPHSPSSAAAVRHRLADELRGRGLAGRVVDDVLLVVSELVGNAVRHGAPLADRGGGIQVDWHVTDSTVRVEVRDGGRGPQEGAPRSTQGSADDESGRGLTIISLLAGSWGSAFDETSAVVWAVVPATLSAQELADDGADRRQEA